MNKTLLLTSIWFQCLWFLAVVGQQSTQLLLLVCVVATVVFSYRYRGIPLSWLLMIVSAGVAMDIMHGVTGLFVFASLPTAGIPLWLALLWVSFAWYAYHMRALLIRFPFAIVCMVGALGAASSYFAGLQLGAVQWPYSHAMTFVIVALEWAFIFALIIYSLNVLEKRRHGVKAHETRPS
ncbi:DUF2878 domain-containing protein [Vibrio ezurae]|uniref:DUF2878 domain-containing protein n=1 Tax=Vibrio ezurae NBRC 102218 TaxID=1219080 RepID=U3B0I3_9VIBR|nr:DUF2878 domain-containing protein [Vibrio ezurae]GAD78992.1 hypothetical protein VEZ01S_08_00280 [Vibrio ezurae NBRC 102218]